MDEFRVERDSMGEMRVPASAYYGASTARAVENFPISGERLPRRMIEALARIKSAAARVNSDFGLLSPNRSSAIIQAADEVAAGKLDEHFPVDIFQTGSGTSSNMNANEVIASRANEILGEILGDRRNQNSPHHIHPNDHVNLQQSSNDVFPTAMQLAASIAITDLLVPALSHLEQRLQAKANQFDEIVKLGRTHLQDATPVRVGQVIGGWAQQVRNGVERALRAQFILCEVPLGGTAVGTGINSHPEFAPRVVRLLAQRSGLDLRIAPNHFEAQSAKDTIIDASGKLRTVAVSLMTVANNLRFLASGPHGGIGELILPATQPGSSIMPGKVNPVMCEMLMQVAARVIGADATIAACAAHGSQFELSVMMPVMASELLTAIELLSSGARVFADRAVAGLEVDRARCRELVERSPALCTALAPVIGYDAAATLAKDAAATGKTIRQLATDRQILPPDQLETLLDPLRMTSPQEDMIGPGGG